MNHQRDIELQITNIHCNGLKECLIESLLHFISIALSVIKPMNVFGNFPKL